MKNFDRQYRMTAGAPGTVGFEIGGTSPHAIHISFSVQKQELRLCMEAFCRSTGRTWWQMR